MSTSLERMSNNGAEKIWARSGTMQQHVLLTLCAKACKCKFLDAFWKEKSCLQRANHGINYSLTGSLQLFGLPNTE